MGKWWVHCSDLGACPGEFIKIQHLDAGLMHRPTVPDADGGGCSCKGRKPSHSREFPQARTTSRPSNVSWERHSNRIWQSDATPNTSQRDMDSNPVPFKDRLGFCRRITGNDRRTNHWKSYFDKPFPNTAFAASCAQTRGLITTGSLWLVPDWQPRSIWIP